MPPASLRVAGAEEGEAVHNTELVVGQMRRKRMLGTEATYRVITVADAHVTVEVVSAPGLPAGMELRLARDAVLALDVVEEPRHSRTAGRTQPSRSSRPQAAA